MYILAIEKSDPSVYSEEHAGVAAELATRIRARKCPDAKAAFGCICICSEHMKMFVNGFKAILGIVCVQKFQSNQSKTIFLLHLRKSSSYKNMV